MSGEEKAFEPTPKQLKFATDLGIPLPLDAGRGDVSRLIRREVRRRGKKVLRERRPKRYDLIEHPRLGLCEIDRVGEDTCKITLLVVDQSRKVVIDAMFLADYPIA